MGVVARWNSSFQADLLFRGKRGKEEVDNKVERNNKVNMELYAKKEGKLWENMQRIKEIVEICAKEEGICKEIEEIFIRVRMKYEYINRNI